MPQTYHLHISFSPPHFLPFLLHGCSSNHSTWSPNSSSCPHQLPDLLLKINYAESISIDQNSQKDPETHFIFHKSIHDIDLQLERLQCFNGVNSLMNVTMAQWKELNALWLGQDGCHFADNIFKCIFLNENLWISINISLKFVPKGPINNIQALVQIMAWRRPGDKPLFEPMMVILLAHICVTQPQWVKDHKLQLIDLIDGA